MALVFVHGIGSRPNIEYYGSVQSRDIMFRKLFIPSVCGSRREMKILNPMWGTHGAKLRWGHASLPHGSLEVLGTGHTFVNGIASVANLGVNSSKFLLSIAQRSVRDAVDLLFSIMDLDGRSASEVEDIVDTAALVVRYCDLVESRHPTEPETGRYPWLANLVDDVDLVEQLERQSTILSPHESSDSEGETLGARHLGSTAQRLFRQGVRNLHQALVGEPLGSAAAGLRRLAGPRVTLLIGDVLKYLAQRGTPDKPGPIVELMVDNLVLARMNSPSDEPLIVVAHSMGSDIMHDILTYFRPDLVVDALVTVGSQIGLFEELNLFGNGDLTIPGPNGRRAPRPIGVRRWLNVVDHNDVLGYLAAPIFEGVDDYEYPSGAAWAHSAYFRQPNFYVRLGARLGQVTR